MARLRAEFDASDMQARGGMRGVEALLLLSDGKPAEALAAAVDGVETRSALGLGHGAVKGALVVALEAAFALADEAKVDELLGILEGLPPGQLTPYYRAVGARYGARRAALRGDADTAAAGFTAAAAIHEELDRPFDLAVVRLEHAEWLVAFGRADEAKPLLDEARETFERLRATPWLERVAGSQSESAESSVIPA